MVTLVPVLLLLLQASQVPAPRPSEAVEKHQQQTTPERTKSDNDQQAPTNGAPLPDKGSADGTKANKQQPTDEHKDKSSTDWWAVGNTALVTIFTGVLAYVAHRQRIAMDTQATYMREGLVETKTAAESAKASAEAAKTSADAAAYQFELTERPWLNVDVKVVGDLVFDPSGISLPMDCVVTNIGKSPTKDVLVKSILHIGHNTRPIDERGALCTELSKEPSFPWVIFPNQSLAANFPLHRDHNYISANLTPGSEYLTIYVITCAFYRPIFNDQAVYYTSTIHVLEANMNGQYFTVVKFGTRVQHKDLGLNSVFGVIGQ